MARLESENIWPIERKDHPVFSGSEKEGLDEQIPEADFENKELAEFAFNHPDIFRRGFLEHVRVESKESYHGKSFACVWPTKFCPVGCECCFFKSPKCAGGKHEDDTSIHGEGRERLIQFINDMNAGEFVIAGGGEPFLEKELMRQIAAEVDADKLFFSSSGIWAKNPQSAETVVDGLHEAHQKNPQKKHLDLRLSFDRFHAERIAPKGDFDYVMNLFNVYRQKYKDENDFKLSFHSMWEDRATMEKLLAMLPVAGRERKDEKTEIVTLADGYSFEVRWKRLFNSNTLVNMHDTPVVNKNAGIFDEDISTEHHGNMSVVFNKDGEEKGADILIHYDGTVLNWGATSPDNEPSIYTHTYDEVMQQIFDDIIGLSFLEKGNDYRDAIIEEVNPEAVKRAKAMNLRDFYSRVVLEESRTRLYVCVRAAQDYIAEGRISADEMNKWPAKVRQLVAMSRDELIEAYKVSDYSIVNEYLDSPKVDVKALAGLYRLVRLGQYDITPEHMVDTVQKSDFKRKEEFIAEVAMELASKIKDSFEAYSKQKGKERADIALLDASKVTCLSQKELGIASEEILAALPPEVAQNFKVAMDFLLADEFGGLEAGTRPIKGEDVTLEVFIQKPGKGKEGAGSEIHVDHIDIQMVVSEAGDLMGLNTQDTATIDGATPDPKREGLHLTSKSDQWRAMGKKEIFIIFPFTPHASGGIGKESKIDRLVLKIKV